MSCCNMMIHTNILVVVEHVVSYVVVVLYVALLVFALPVVDVLTV